MSKPRTGTVFQRHSRRCPKDADGNWRPHRCKGVWGYQFDVGDAQNRKRIYRSGYPTRAAAEAALREITDLSATRRDIHKLSVGNYLDSWIEGKHALKPTTRSHYRDAIRLYLKPHLGDVLLIDLRADHLDRMYSAMTQGASGRPLGPASLHRVHACLRSALNTAVKRRMLNHNPALHVELPPERPRRPEPWSAEQCRQFLTAIDHDRLALLYRVLIVTGMRRGEVVGLRWADVDLRQANLRIVQQITTVGGQPVAGPPKTRRGHRVVPIDTDTLDRLRQHLITQREERQAWGTEWDVYGLVFTREDGSTVRPDYITKHFGALVRRAGLPMIRLHDLRHTNATLALEAGVEVKVVSERLGHANTGITQDIYMHVAPRLGRDAADRIASLIQGSDPARTLASTPNGGAMVAQRGQNGQNKDVS